MFTKKKDIEQLIHGAFTKAQEAVNRVMLQFIEEQRGFARALLGKVEAYMSKLDETNAALRLLEGRVIALEAQLLNKESADDSKN